MKDIYEHEIEHAIRHLFLQSNYIISPDIKAAMNEQLEQNSFPLAKATLEQILQNYQVAEQEQIPLCQDCGMALLFAEIGTEVHIHGDFEAAVNRGVSAAYRDGYLRKSVVAEPLFDRKNTTDNTPAVIYVKMTTGEHLKLTAVAKGFGSENTSRLKMFIPSNAIDEIEAFVLETVSMAGPNACPPIIVGVGIGGTLDKAALLAKQATIRTIGHHNLDSRYAKLEEKWLADINHLGIGPAGFGGAATAIAVNIEYYATHIASIPVAVNLCCQVSRHAELTL